MGTDNIMEILHPKMFVRTVPIHPLGRKLHDKVDEEEAADVDSRQHIVYADEAMLSNL